MNPNLSGVAKFNALLAQRFQVACISFEELLAQLEHLETGLLLLSVKVRDMTPSEIEQAKTFLASLDDRTLEYDLFFHSFNSLDLEYSLVERSRQIFCGNAEIQHALEGMDKPLIPAWCPMLMDPNKAPLREAKLNLFAFGMAHKIQVRYFTLLRDFMAENELDYQLWVSTAFHEKANFGDFGLISDQLSGVFESRIQFMGFLSDEAVNYFLRKAQVFVTFFERGVRANNTSVYTAMEKGCAVLTNLDEHSPDWMIHRQTMLDIRQIKPDDFDPVLLAQIGQAAQQAVQTHASWDRLGSLMAAKILRSVES